MRTASSDAETWREWWLVSSGLEPVTDACLPSVAVLAPISSLAKDVSGTQGNVPANPKPHEREQEQEGHAGRDRDEPEHGPKEMRVNLAHFADPRPLRCLYSLVVHCDARMHVIASGVLQEQHAFASTMERAWCYELPVECDSGDFGLLIAPAVLAPAGPDAQWLTLVSTPEQFTTSANVAAMRVLSTSTARLVRCVESYLSRSLPTIALHVCVLPCELAPRRAWATTGIVFASETELCTSLADVERVVDTRVRLCRVIASQWFGLGGARPEDMRRDAWLLEGLGAHVASAVVAKEFGASEVEWRRWGAEKELVAAFAKAQVATGNKSTKKKAQQQQQQTEKLPGTAATTGTSTGGAGGSSSRSRGLPHLALLNEQDRALAANRAAPDSESLWSIRAAVVIELLTRHGPSPDTVRDLLRRLFGSGSGARCPRLSADAFVSAFARECGDAMLEDTVTLFRRRWIDSNAVPQIEIGSLYDTNKGYLHIACRQDQVGFLPGRREEDAGGYVMLEIHTRKKTAVQQHRVIMRRRRVLREEKFIYIKKQPKKKDQKEKERMSDKPVNPVVYIVADPRGAWLANIDMRQPEAFLAAMLRGERKMRTRLASLEAAERFFARVPRRKSAAPSTGTVLVAAIFSVLIDKGETPRVRQRAADALVGAGARETPGAGLVQLIRFFRTARVGVGGAQRPNDFSARAEHGVLRSVCAAMARATVHLQARVRAGAFDEVTTSSLSVMMRDAATLLISALACNDNRRNAYDDTEWLVLLADCAAMLLRCKSVGVGGHGGAGGGAAEECVTGALAARAIAGLDAFVTKATSDGMAQPQLVPECCRASADALVALAPRLGGDEAVRGVETMLEAWALRAARVSALGALHVHAASAMLVRRGAASLETYIVRSLLRPYIWSATGNAEVSAAAAPVEVPAIRGTGVGVCAAEADAEAEADGLHVIAAHAARRALAAARSSSRLAKTDFPLAALVAEVDALLRCGAVRGDARRALVLLQRVAAGGKEPPAMPRVYHALETALVSGSADSARRAAAKQKLLVKIRQPVSKSGDGDGRDATATTSAASGKKKKLAPKLKIKKLVASAATSSEARPSDIARAQGEKRESSPSSPPPPPPPPKKKMKITLKKKKPLPADDAAPVPAPAPALPPAAPACVHEAAPAPVPDAAPLSAPEAPPARPMPRVKLKLKVGIKRLRDAGADVDGGGGGG